MIILLDYNYRYYYIIIQFYIQDKNVPNLFAFCTIIWYNDIMIRYKNLFYKHISVENAPTQYTSHLETGYEFLVFVNGNASFNIMGRIYPLKPWDLVIIPPKLYHHLIVHDNQVYERMLFQFDLVNNDEPDLQKLLQIPRVINVKNNTPIRNLFSRLFEYTMLFSVEDFHDIIKPLFSEFLMLLKLLNPDDQSNPTSYSPVIKKLLNLIALNYDKPITIKFLADELFLSESYIKNLFSATMHTGLKHYINNLRILKAQALIKKGIRPTEVYTQCGFSNYATFFKAYQHFTGKSPSNDILS